MQRTVLFRPRNFSIRLAVSVLQLDHNTYRQCSHCALRHRAKRTLFSDKNPSWPHFGLGGRKPCPVERYLPRGGNIWEHPQPYSSFSLSPSNPLSSPHTSSPISPPPHPPPVPRRTHPTSEPTPRNSGAFTRAISYTTLAPPSTPHCHSHSKHDISQTW